MVEPELGAPGEGLDEGVVDEQLASGADVDGVFGEGEAAEGEEDEEGAGHGVAPGARGFRVRGSGFRTFG